MTARRLISVLSVGLIASASVVAAQPSPPAAKKAPKTPAKKQGPKGPLAPAKDGDTPAKTGPAATGSTGTPAKTGPAATGSPGTPAKTGPAATGSTGAPAKTGAAATGKTGAAATGSAAGAATSAGEGSAVQMTEDPPPRDMTGIDENPDAPKSLLDTDSPTAVVSAPVARPRAGYPIELVPRPITLPQNMSEVSVNPHAQVSPYASATALRARYGITPKIQLGLTYMVGGIFDDPSTRQSKQAFHPGKAVGIDVTVMLQDWIGVQVGVPVYISPLATSITVGAPIKFTYGDKYAIGGLDDLLNIRVSRFAPTFYQELQNATNANDTMINTIKSQGELRISLFGLYQYEPDLAIIGRAGVQMEDFASGKTDGCVGECLTTFIYAGVSYSPRRYLDLGATLGFDDLAHGGSFAPAGYLAFRI